MACIYKVQYFLGVFLKTEKKWRLQTNFHGFVYSVIAGICKIFFFLWMKLKLRNEYSKFHAFKKFFSHTFNLQCTKSVKKRLRDMRELKFEVSRGS